MRLLRRGRHRGPVVAALLGALVAAGAPFATLASAGASLAHGGGGQITLLRAESTGPDTVAVEVCVTFVLDRDQADTARVTLGATGPGDLEVRPVTMAVGDQPGLRTGELTFPEDGSWTMQVTSTFPPAQLAVPVTVDGDRAAAGSTPGPVGGAVAATCEAEGGPGLPAWLVAGLGTAAAVAVFGGLLLLLRRATAGDEAGEPEPTADAASLRPHGEGPPPRPQGERAPPR
ncbi:MAG: hypothetical protein JNK12_17845 [Acidimicrobiales bacterium]|nr:hypothetical protein [Acidimicrobiales bacterium]